MKKKNRIKKFFNRFDGFKDVSNERGSSKDITTRLYGYFKTRYAQSSDDLYYSNGFLQNIVNQPAEDATREWFTIKTNLDTEEQNISRLIQLRLDELDLKRKLKNLIINSRKYQMGGMFYYGILGSTPQSDLSKTLPSAIEKLDYINVVDNPDTISVLINNRTDATLKDYMRPEFTINGKYVHSSRISWLVNDFNTDYMRGFTPLDVCYDAIIAQDSSLWSVSKLMSDMVTKIFKSDMFVSLSPNDKIEFLEKMKHYMETNGAVALTQNEDFQKMTYSFTGIREIFDFIFENLSGMSRIPKNILLGKAHGVVTAGEYDSLNYYSQIAKLQENELTPIINKIIDMIISEKKGPVSIALGNKINQIDYEIEWNSLWELDPLSDADRNLKLSQRDQIDVTIGKASPQEVRELDKRYNELQTDGDIVEIANVLNMDEPANEE